MGRPKTDTSCKTCAQKQGQLADGFQLTGVELGGQDGANSLFIGLLESRTNKHVPFLAPQTYPITVSYLGGISEFLIAPTIKIIKNSRLTNNRRHEPKKQPIKTQLSPKTNRLISHGPGLIDLNSFQLS